MPKQPPTAPTANAAGPCPTVIQIVGPRHWMDGWMTCDSTSFSTRGWSGGAMVLGKLPVAGGSYNLITVGQGPIALAVGAGGCGLDIFTLIYPFSSFSLSSGDGPI